jgi:plastocyanin
MQRFNKTRSSSTAPWWIAMMAVVIASPGVHAAAWTAAAGAQTNNKGNQALAFLPNEMWIRAGDAITWKVDTDEVHTMTFLSPGQVRPLFSVGCPGSTPNGSGYNGSACVHSGILGNGQTYTVQFPNPGNFKLVCLIHTNMTGLVHVLSLPSPLSHDQRFYDNEAGEERRGLLGGDNDFLSESTEPDRSDVVAGTGGIIATGGGFQTISVMRFLSSTVIVRVGDTVEWHNLDPVTKHTVTFGIEPSNAVPPSSNVTTDADGAEHAMIGSPTDSVNSGFLGADPQDRVGLAQSPPGVTRFRVTFTHSGTFNYICAIHDNLGMLGKVVVHQ